MSTLTINQLTVAHRLLWFKRGRQLCNTQLLAPSLPPSLPPQGDGRENWEAQREKTRRLRPRL